jgi:hypothetical protein
MALGSVTFKITKSIDKLYLDLPEKLTKKFNVKLGNSQANISTQFAGAIHPTTIEEFNSNQDLIAIKSTKAELVHSMTVYFTMTDFGGSQWHYSISRQEPLDQININFTSCPDNARGIVLQIVAFIRSTLLATDSVAYLDGITNEHLKSIYQKRETEINHLESISKSLVFDQEKYRQKLESDFENRIKKLEQDFEEKKKDLKAKELELDQKVKTVDDRAAKHARRAVTASLKDELKNRSQEFKLSKGTIQLRNPIEYFSWILIGFFAVLFFITTLVSLKLVGTATDVDMPALYIKQFALGIALVSSSVFYIRWRNLWFERHAQEEFLLKRQEIDLDRATWAIELASEWVDEKKRDIPEGLVTKITNNLFEYQNHEAKNLHPAEDLASLILGSSSKVKLNVGGNEFELNTKGVKNLKKSLSEE